MYTASSVQYVVLRDSAIVWKAIVTYALQLFLYNEESNGDGLQKQSSEIYTMIETDPKPGNDIWYKS